MDANYGDRGFVGSGRRNTIIFPFQFPALCSPTATSIKGTFLFSLRRLPIKPHPSPQTFPNVTYPGILSRQVGEKKQLDLLLYQFPPTTPPFKLPIAQWIPKLDLCSLDVTCGGSQKSFNRIYWRIENNRGAFFYSTKVWNSQLDRKSSVVLMMIHIYSYTTP